METQIMKPTNLTPAELIMAAVSGQADLEKVEKLLELQERWEKRQAEKAYNKAISDFKSNPPEIIKETSVDFKSERTGQRTHYKYAALANVIEKVTPELSKHGLAISWRTSMNGKVSVTCRISHELGHYEETTLSADSDTSGSKNPIQAMGSAITYMQRYTALALLGLACSDADDDGRGSGAPIETKEVKPAEVVQNPITLKDRVMGTAITKFNGNMLAFDIWRAEKKLVVDLDKATPTELNYVLTLLREYKPNK